ncbi:hypothetical protein [Bacillus niameyensis]|uniref:hypothetical protein n=1 Tax=Bacillus niameyensis TaxID=1522308 RepID=UPI0007819EB5|nr:hypothetical protein [Bacillus niameyensis]
MNTINLELRKVVIDQAYRNRAITQKHYEALKREIQAEAEKIRYQETLREFKNKELIERYLENSHM